MLLNRDMLLDKKFSVRKKGGYDHHEVDSFLDELASEVAELDKQRAADSAELSRMREIEHALTTTMVTAQKTSRQLVEDAEKQATQIVADAKAQALSITMKAEQEGYEKTKAASQDLISLQDKASDLKIQAEGFYAKLLADMESYLTSLKTGGFIEFVQGTKFQEETEAPAEFVVHAQEQSVPEPGNTFDLSAFLGKPLDSPEEKVENSNHEQLHSVLESYAQAEVSKPVNSDELHMSFGTDMTSGASIDMTEIYANAPVSDDELKALIDELVE